MLGYKTVGAGAAKVVVLNDWMCDTSTWNPARDYLDGEQLTWAFADVRGYGRSRGQRGAFGVEEAAGDVLALADALGWGRFSIVGHSMTTLVALHLAQQRAERIARAVVLTPPPPSGFGADDAMLAQLRATAFASDDERLAGMRARSGDRLSPGWLAFKLARWRATSDPEAVAGYAVMFARHGLPDPARRISVPVLAVTGEQDAEIMRHAAVTRLLTPLCEQLTVTAIADSGHYPMQETPPRLVAIVEQFLAGDRD